MNRIQHIKVVSNDPGRMRFFLRAIADLPEGFDIPAYGKDPADGEPRMPPLASKKELSWEDIGSTRRMTGEPGFIAGSVESRQIQVFPSDQPDIWAIAIGTRDVEGTHAKCLANDFPTTPIVATPFNGGIVRAFFVIVGGITFEFMRVEPADSSN